MAFPATSAWRTPTTDIHEQVGKFDYVMANPPFSQNAVDRERLKDDKKRFPFGMPSVDSANYLWIQLF
ncbi:N-6 DNA methylase [Sorangium sp. So ce233]